MPRRNLVKYVSPMTHKSRCCKLSKGSETMSASKQNTPVCD